MTATQLDQLADDLGKAIPEHVRSLAPHIREAAAAVLDEKQDSDGTPKLSVSIAVCMNLATHPISYTLRAGVSVKRTVAGEYQLDDPEQTKLDLA